MNRTILVTGATSGFGKAIATQFAQHNFQVIITGRRQDRLDALQEELEEKYNTSVISLCFDIRDNDATKAAISMLSSQVSHIDILVNNAGLAAGLATIDEGDTDNWDRMIDTNIKGLLHVTQSVIPILKRNSGGHIVNIGSIAGKEVYPGGNVYCASKHAVDALSKAMRIDLLPYDIKVTNIAPGAAETEFSLVRFKGDDKQADKIYDGYTPLVAQDIAETIEFVVERPKHVTINDLTIMPTAQASAVVLKK